MQGKSKHPKTQLSAPSLGDGLELKEILFLEKKKKKKKAITSFRQRNLPCRWDPLQVLLVAPVCFGWPQPHQAQEALSGLGLSGARVITWLAEISGKKVSGELPACAVGSSGGKKTNHHPKTCLYS